MNMRQTRIVWASLGMVVALLTSGCSTAVGGASAVVEAVTTNTHAKESRRRAEMQSDIQAFDEARAPAQVESESAYLSMVVQMQRQGLWFASLAHIDALEARWKPSDYSQLLRADALRQTGDKAVSTVLYQRLQNGPYAARAMHGQGLLAAAEGRFAEAATRLQAAQKLAPTDALLLNDLGYALLHTPRASEAGLPLKQAAQLQPKNPRIQSNLALYLALFAPPAEALAWMNQSEMSTEQRMRVLQQAQRLGNGAVSAEVTPLQGWSAPQAPAPQPDAACQGCLIFEKQLGTPASAS